MGRRKLRVALDERTRKMPDVALDHRGFNHPWVRMPVSPERFAELAAAGLKEIVRHCACGTVWTQVFNRTSGERVEQQRVYTDKSYHVPKGSGRMSKAAARAALFAREDEALYAKR